MGRMSLDEEISAIEATVNGLENEMESGKFSVKTIADELQSHINSTSDFTTQMAKGQETMDRILDKISKLDIGYLTALKYNHSHEPHVCEVLNRAANCIMKFMDIGFAANELFGDPDVRAQIKSQNQELRENLKKMLSLIISDTDAIKAANEQVTTQLVMNDNTTANKLTEKELNKLVVLGYSYVNGHGAEQNLEKAIDCFVKAAEQGYAPAQYCLGFHYAKGNGVPQDLAKANYWFTKAAEQGNKHAQFSLGYHYEGGKGMPQDLVKANYWYAKAAEQGYASAQYNLGFNYARGDGVPQDFEKANYWFAKAAEQDDIDAQFFLGLNYLKGNGTPQDIDKAMYWLTKSAEHGSEKAKDVLAKLF